MNQLKDFLIPTQKELYSALNKMFRKKAICKKDSYILIPGEAPIMLVAHLDTVHRKRVKQICTTRNDNILMSPQGIGGDDRCGVYALVTAHKLSCVKPWLLFTCDEEIGGIGAREFCRQHKKDKLPKGLKDLKVIIELDRKGKNDAVYYDCDNKEFEAYITDKGFKTDVGSFSDISYIAPELGVAAVNLSSGYYNAHTQHEFIDRKQLNATIKKVVEIIDDTTKTDFPKYEYVEADYTHFDMSYGRYTAGLGDAWGYEALEFEEDFERYEVPEELRGMYKELMYFYHIEELEDYRIEFGDNCIPMLYESEFGVSYSSLEDAGDTKVE